MLTKSGQKYIDSITAKRLEDDPQEDLINAATDALGTLRVASLFGKSLFAAPVTLELERAIKGAIRAKKQQ